MLLPALAACSLWAQSPQYRPPPPPSMKGALEVRLRYLFAPDINFTGLGSVDFLPAAAYESANNIYTGTERAILYDDGELRQDYILTTVIGGGEANQEKVLPSDVTGNPNIGTANFTYTNESQVTGENSDALLFHRYAAAAPENVDFEGDSSGSLGWELNYTQFFGRKRNFGMQVGFSFNGFDSDYNGLIESDLLVQTFRHEMVDGVTVPDLPDEIENEDGTTTQPPFQGVAEREDVNSAPQIDWGATEETSEILPGEALVDSNMDFRSSVYNFRAGPTYALNLGQRFAFQVGAGLSAIYFSGRFSAFELQIVDEAVSVTRGLTTTEDAEWQVGGYVDANAYYRFNDRVSLFSGFQVQSGSTYSQMNEEREASVDFSSQMYVHAGLGIRF